MVATRRSRPGGGDIRVVHKFAVPEEREVREWQPPELVDCQTSTMVSLPVQGPGADNLAWMKVK